MLALLFLTEIQIEGVRNCIRQFLCNSHIPLFILNIHYVIEWVDLRQVTLVFNVSVYLLTKEKVTFQPPEYYLNH